MSQQIKQLLGGDALDVTDAEALFESMLGGALNDIEISAALTALKMRGESGVEIATLVSMLRERAVKIDKPEAIFADCAGTGGDGLGTFNVSTAAALTAVTCGVPILKHGNRASSSPSGSADIIERVGFDLALSPEQLSTVFNQTGFAFIFAPAFHPLVGRVMPVRKTLATATIFNLAGPLANPAAPPVQLMGVCDRALLKPMAEVLQRIGCRKGLVVYGSGLDEVAIHDATEAVYVTQQDMTEMTLTVEDFGVDKQSLQSIQLGDDDALDVFNAVIDGVADEAKLATVAINTAAIIWLADKAPDLRTATEMAMLALTEKRVRAKLDEIITAVERCR
ncbi:MAG: anthranilate phosphoribosyltransferase [Gammaproteobacteria bacterium]